jgi:hypothetical protein
MIASPNALKMDVASFPIDEETVKLQSLTSKVANRFVSGPDDF